MKKIITRILLLALAALVLFAARYAWLALPIVSGYGAKILCSCVFVSHRSSGDVLANELSPFPLSVGNYEVDREDSSATGSILGLAEKKAIFRKGLGCTLINDFSETAVRAQTFALATPPVINPDTVRWPAGDQLTDTLPPGLDTAALRQAVAYAFAEPQTTGKRRTRAVVIVYDGQLVAEHYAPGFDRHSRFAGWSMAKSLMSAVIGKLVSQGKLVPDAPAPVAAWQNDDRKSISLNHLMHATSGLAWREVYSGPSDATNMLFRRGDVALFAAQHPLKYEPGKHWQYSSGTSNILSGIVRNATRDAAYHRYPYEQLFYPLGMYSVVLEPDASGTFVGSSFAHATARDWARFGLLYYYRGQFQGRQLLPESWIDYTITPAAAAPDGRYGAQWWLNAGSADDAAARYYPRLPRDLFWADGYEGQNLFVLPSRKLVVVKLSLSHGDFLDDEAFLNRVIDALPAH